MADITPYTNQIESARLGREVRGSIVSALLAMNDDINDDTESARSYAAASSASATTCQNISDNLQDAIDTVQNLNTTVTAAEGQRVAAEQQRAAAEAARESSETGYVAQARQYAQQAAQYASSDNAKLSESWAIGGTGTRYGEDSNNSKYWCDLASEIVTAGGVSTFNGRTGNVVPTSDDYTSTLIKRGSGTVETSLTSLESSVSTNTNAITTNANNIATNTAAITANTTAISNNATAIAENAEDISDLQDATTTTFANGTVGSDSAVSGADNKRCLLVKTGKIVRCYLCLGYTNGTTELGNNKTYFTIPEGYRPKTQQIFPAIAWRASGIVIAPNLTYRTDGVVTTSSSGTGNITCIYGNAEWETD